MENQLEKMTENGMDAGIICWFIGIRVSQNLKRIIVFWGLDRGPPIYGNYRLGKSVEA